ncbi:hypothetical protein JTM17_35635, partial [Pseudomonas aeruginosa]|nr:hypothetical protein [Pseudomonas aeruginosa]
DQSPPELPRQIRILRVLHGLLFSIYVDTPGTNTPILTVCVVLISQIPLFFQLIQKSLDETESEQ